MGAKAYVVGMIFGAICTVLGFAMGRTEHPAFAEANGGEGSGYVLATPSSSSGDYANLIYVLKTSPAEEPQLSVYTVKQGGRELQLTSSRRLAWDTYFTDFEAGPQSTNAEKMKVLVDEDKKKREKPH